MGKPGDLLQGRRLCRWPREARPSRLRRRGAGRARLAEGDDRGGIEVRSLPAMDATSRKGSPDGRRAYARCNGQGDSSIGELTMTSVDPKRRDLLKFSAATGGSLAMGDLPGTAEGAEGASAAAGQGAPAPSPIDVVLRVNG